MLDNIIDINKFCPQFLIIDLECINGYFSFQYRNEVMSKAKAIQCINDDDIYNLYENVICKITRPMYAYSIDYDKVMLQALCKMIENKETDLIMKLRKFNNYLMKNINYFLLNRHFWCDYYFKIKENNPTIKSKDIMEMAKLQMKAIYQDDNVSNFIDEFSHVFGKSKVFKNLIINSIPKILYYYVINKDLSLKPTISLKKLQLINEGYNIKWDFNFDSDWNTLTKDEQDEFIKYSLNDVDFLYRFFEKTCLPEIKNRYYAYKAAKMIDNSLELTNKVLYSENDTDLIVNVLKKEDKKEEIQVDYVNNIDTPNHKFNEFVEFVQNSNCKTDKLLKEEYCNHFQANYIDDDKNIFSPDGYRPDIQIGSFDEIALKNLTCKYGLGGLHGAINNIIETDLLLLDYESEYPSIILQYQEMFSKIMRVDRYLGFYNLKNTQLKVEKKKLKDKVSELYEIIHVGGNDGADIAEFGPEIEHYELRINEIDHLIRGAKLILNKTYGLINSNFDLPISYKPLGRFICLKGQSLIINLAYKLPEDSNLINVNTDGIILKTSKLDSLDKVIYEDKNGFFKLEKESIDKIIQKDVNNYLRWQNGALKSKGVFHPSIKQIITKNEKLSINLINAIRLLENKTVEIKPIYFDSKWFKMEETAWYFTNCGEGVTAIKETVKPEIIGIGDTPFFFTKDINKASIERYQEFAERTKDKIIKFKLEEKVEFIKYYEELLFNDTEENYKIKQLERRKLLKMFPKNVGLVGFKGDAKVNSVIVENGKTKNIKPLVYYTMTEIMKSTFCNGFSLHGDYLIIDVDIYDRKTNRAKIGWEVCKPFLQYLKSRETFEAWNNKTIKYNRKYIFQPKQGYQLPKEVEGYIEIIKKATIWTMENTMIKYENNMMEVKEI